MGSIPSTPTKDKLHISTRNYPDGRHVVTRRLAPDSISIIVETTFRNGSRSTLFTVERPPRHRDESPIQYYRRTKVVDDRFTHRHKGWYYCNPAHCSGRWKDKTKRDAHLNMAYAILD